MTDFYKFLKEDLKFCFYKVIIYLFNFLQITKLKGGKTLKKDIGIRIAGIAGEGSFITGEVLQAVRKLRFRK